MSGSEVESNLLFFHKFPMVSFWTLHCLFFLPAAKLPSKPNISWGECSLATYSYHIPLSQQLLTPSNSKILAIPLSPLCCQSHKNRRCCQTQWPSLFLPSIFRISSLGVYFLMQSSFWCSLSTHSKIFGHKNSEETFYSSKPIFYWLLPFSGHFWMSFDSLSMFSNSLLSWINFWLNLL